MSELTLTAKRPAIARPSNPMRTAARTLWFWLRKELRIRSTVRTLEALSDHHLKDIGLERRDLEGGVRARWPGC